MKPLRLTACALFFLGLAFAVTNAAFAQSNPPLIVAETDLWDFDWTVVAMDPDGAWGVGTAISTIKAMSIAFANCKKISKKKVGCGAYLKTMRAGWILAFRCGSEIILEADKKLKNAENLAIAREFELRQIYVRDMPACKLIFAVDPHGVVARENLGITRRVPITEDQREFNLSHHQ